MMADRSGFLSRLVSTAKEHGNTIYEELQGNSVVRSAIADWKEIAADTGAGVKEDLDTVAAWVSPTIDATPGKHTLEDTIDNLIFDAGSELAPLDLIGMGAASTTKAALGGLKRGATAVGMKFDDLFRAKEKVRRVATPLAPKAKRPVSKVAEGMAHDVGGSSVEASARKAAGIHFVKIDRAGKVTPVIQNAEDAGSFYLNRGVPGHAIVRVSPGGNSVEGGVLVNKAMNTAFDTLVPKAPKAARKAKTVVLDLGKKADDADFLKNLGVAPGRGPQL